MTADATPCLARGSDATIALVAGVIASAAPAPITTVDEHERPVTAAGPERGEQPEPDRATPRGRCHRRAGARTSPTASRPPPRSAGSRCSSAAARARPRTCCSRAPAAGTGATRRRSRTWRRTAGTTTPIRWRSRGGGTAAGRAAASSVRSSTQMNPTRKTTPPISATSVNGSLQPRSGPSMIPSTSSADPEGRQHRADAGRGPTCSSDAVLGTTSDRRRCTTAAASDRGDEEDRAPPELLEQRARHEDAEGAAGTGEAGPDADRLGALLRREHAGDRRQRAGHEERGAEAGERRAARSAVRPSSTIAPTAATPMPKMAVPAISAPRRPNRSPIAPAGSSSAASASA